MGTVRVLRQYWPALLYGTAAALPFASLLLQTIIANETGIRLTTGAGLFHLFATAAVGLPALLLSGVFVYRTRRLRPRPPYPRLLLFAFFAATVIVALWFLALEPEAWCGGTMGECGRWI